MELILGIGGDDGIVSSCKVEMEVGEVQVVLIFFILDPFEPEITVGSGGGGGVLSRFESIVIIISDAGYDTECSISISIIVKGGVDCDW